MAVLEVKNLHTHYIIKKGTVRAVEDVSFDVEAGQTFGLAGESGCGKTTCAFSIMRILPRNATIPSGEILIDNDDVVKKSERQMSKARWRDVSIVFQYAMNAFNPVMNVGDQIVEAIMAKGDYKRIEKRKAKSQAWKRTQQLFEIVGLDPARVKDYPHHFSGGMRQRAIIAMALACNPKIIIADEPVTALDVVVQSKILKLLKDLQKQFNLGVIVITHDLAVIAQSSDTVGIMYAGHLVETGTAVEVFNHSLHPYTKALCAAFPNIKGVKREIPNLEGLPPSLLNPPLGCRFHPRCARAEKICSEKVPEFKEYRAGHKAACFFAGE